VEGAEEQVAAGPVTDRRPQQGEGDTPEIRQSDAGYKNGGPGNPRPVQDERQADLIMATALARALTDVIVRLDGEICGDTTVAELRMLAARAEAELEEAA
jgi:hypothetical protein